MTATLATAADRPRDRHLRLLYASLFVVMVGYGSTLAVLPYHARRIGALADAGPDTIAFHIGLLTSVYALAQLVAGPAVGHLADRYGRPAMLIAGLGGLAATQAAFGLTTSLSALYLARFAGGLFAACLLVAATTYIADRTGDGQRTRAMAAYGTSVSLGLVAGPVIAGALSRPGIDWAAGVVRVDSYSLPFLFSAAATLAVLIYAAPRFAEPAATPPRQEPSLRRPGPTPSGPERGPRLGSLLALVALAQYGLAIFEGTFVLYARDRLSLSAVQATWAFVVCGVVMALQLPAATLLARVASPVRQTTIGFALMGAGTAAIVASRSYLVVLAMIAVLAAGAAVVIPNLAALVAADAREGAGLALGWKSSASSLGQFLGPLAGGVLVGVRLQLPFLMAGAMLLAVAVSLTRRARPGGGGIRRVGW